MRKYLFLFLLVISSSVSSALFNRGNGLIYDDVLNVTWLQDANYAQTSGYDDDGLMRVSDAIEWASNLEFGGFTDWRLSTATPIDGVNYNIGTHDGNDGSSEIGWNITSPNMELAYMYYVNLNGVGRVDTDGNVNSVYGITTESYFFNIQDVYIYETYAASEINPNGTSYWATRLDIGLTGTTGSDLESQQWSAWALRDGDVSAVPVPSAVWLFGSGLIGLVGLARKKK